MRIISAVPSLTELLFDLGLEDEVVGITKFCVHPEKWFRTKTRIGGTKDIKIDIVKELHPTLILANKEENTKEDIEACMEFCQVHLNDVSTYEEALEMIGEIGQLTHRVKEAHKIITEISKKFKVLPSLESKPKSIYLIWKDPIMAVGGDSFINDMMKRAGFDNVLKSKKRYPTLTPEDLTALGPEVLMLSSEPYPFSEKHLEYFKSLVPESKILFVDGEMFSWYGSRMRLAADYFNNVSKKL